MHRMFFVIMAILPICLEAQVLPKLFATGDSLRMLMQFEPARAYYSEIDNIARSQEDWHSAILAGTAMVRMDFVEKRYTEAESRALGLIDLANEYGVRGMPLASCYNMCGGIVGEWKNDYAGAIEFHKRALNELDTCSSSQCRDTRGRTIGSIGIGYANLGDLNLALHYYQVAIDTFIAVNGPIHRNVSIGYTSIADIHWMRAEYEQAVVLYEKALQLQTRLLPADHPINLRVISDLGQCHADAGNLDRAMDYLQRAEAMAVQLFGPESADAARRSFLIADLQRRQGLYDHARSRMELALQHTISLYGPSTGQVEEILAGITSVYSELNLMDKAVEAAKQSLAINLQLRPRHPATAASYTRLGTVYRKTGSSFLAIEALDSALVCLEAMFQSEHPQIAQTYLEKANVFMDSGDLSAADVAIRRAMAQFGVHRTTEQRAAFSMDPLVIRILQARINVAVERAEEPDTLIALIAQGIRFIDDLLASHTSPGTQSFWLETLFPFYDQCMDVVYLLYFRSPSEDLFELGLAISEGSKSALLRQHLRAEEALVRGGIPDLPFQKEKRLKQEVRMYTSLLTNPLNEAGDDQLKFWQQALHTARTEYSALIAQLEQNYPDYYQLKYEQRTFLLDEVMAALPKNQLAIEFFYGNKRVHILCFDQNAFTWNSSTRVDSLKNAVVACRAVSERQGGISAQKFEQAASLIWTELLGEALGTFASTQRICIVPDGPLYQMPFDLVLTESNSNANWQTMHFLIKSYAISYANTLTGRGKAHATVPTTAYVGLAPSYPDHAQSESRAGLGQLPFAKDEVASCASIWNGQHFSDTSANERVFRQVSAEAAILHLAAHAEINHQSPALSKFVLAKSDTAYDHLLHVYEIYDMTLGSQLAVLSACQTGMGPVQRGEGIRSLSRAFQYAGVPSVMMSLWNVPDQTTGEIVTEYMRNLKEGDAKDLALRKAKMQFLESTDAERSHPFYWAGLTQTGDLQAIQSRSNRPATVLGVTILLLIVAVGFWLRWK